MAQTKMKKKGANTSLVFTNKMYFFLIPALAFFLIFWIYPVLQLFYYSVTNFNGVNYDFDFVGMKNYIKVLNNGTLTNSMKNTLVYAVITVLLSNVVGLAVAMILNTKIRLKGLFRTCAYFPALFSAIVIGFIWSYVYMPGSGMIASILSMIGLDGAAFNPLGNYKTALYAIAIVEAWKAFGTTMIIYLAGLQTVDESLLEAGRIDGCTEWQLFRKIVLPLVAPGIAAVSMLSFMYAWNEYTYTVIFTRIPANNTVPLALALLNTEDNLTNFGLVAAGGVILVIPITLFVIFAQNYLISGLSSGAVKE